VLAYDPATHFNDLTNRRRNLCNRLQSQISYYSSDFSLNFSQGSLENHERNRSAKRNSSWCEEGTPSTAIREISLMKELKHVNIVRLPRRNPHGNETGPHFEYCEQDLKKYMDQHETVAHLNRTQSVSFMFPIVEGNRLCHENQVLHRDLSPKTFS